MEQSEILEPVHNCLRELIELERNGKSQDFTYTDSDVTAVSLLFSIINGNRLVSRLIEDKAPIGLSRDLNKSYSESIVLLTKQMTGINLNDPRRRDNSK